jgi:hypothetical protein
MTNEPPTDATDPAEPDPAENGSPVDPLDERLSAELDGADGAATSETPSGDGDEARIEVRRRALESARDLLAVPPPPLDDVTRQRMLRVAGAEWPQAKRRDPRWLNRVAVAAALVVIVALTGLMVKALDGSRSSGSKASRANAAAGTTALPGTAPHDLNEVSDPAVLRRRVEDALRAETSRAAGPQQQPTTTAATRGGNATQEDSAARCLSAVRVPAGATPSILADATFDGAPAVVVVAHDGPRILVFVLATSDCRLLSSQFLRQ